MMNFVRCGLLALYAETSRINVAPGQDDKEGSRLAESTPDSTAQARGNRRTSGLNCGATNDLSAPDVSWRWRGSWRDFPLGWPGGLRLDRHQALLMTLSTAVQHTDRRLWEHCPSRHLGCCCSFTQGAPGSRMASALESTERLVERRGRVPGRDRGSRQWRRPDCVGVAVRAGFRIR